MKNDTFGAKSTLRQGRKIGGILRHGRKILFDYFTTILRFFVLCRKMLYHERNGVVFYGVFYGTFARGVVFYDAPPPLIGGGVKYPKIALRNMVAI